MDAPEVTVLMSVYNGEKYLREAIESILAQTFRDFEFLIIDDCSTDSSAAILKSYDDPRIRVIRNEKNMGPAKSSNVGLGIARGKYIARLDADDVSLPDRLVKQYGCMESEPDLAICAASYQIIDENGNNKRTAKYYLSSEQLYYNLSFANFLAHSATFFRRDTILALGGYDENLRLSEDYDLWHRVSRMAKIVHMEDVLVKWRDHAENLSSANKNEMSRIARSIAFNWLDRICDHRLDRQLIRELCEWEREPSFSEVSPDALIRGLIFLNRWLIAAAPEYVDRQKLREIGWQRVHHYIGFAFGQRRIISLLKTMWPNLFNPGYAKLLGRSLAGSVYSQMRGLHAHG